MFSVTVGLVLITVFDVVIHVATDQVEPLRITGNIIVLVATLSILAIRASRLAILPVAAGAANLVLNIVHIANEGIGTLGVILIAATTVLCLVIGRLLARRTTAAR